MPRTVKLTALNADPVGSVDISTRLGLSRQAVHKWSERRPTTGYPEARWSVSGNPVWDWNVDIVAWLRATGRPYRRVDVPEDGDG